MTANNIQDYQMFIDGQWTEAENNQRFESTNPESNKPWSSFPDATVNDVNNSVAAAKNAFKTWSLSDVKIRAKYLRAIGDQLKKNAEHIGKIETIDSGKLLKETKFQAEYMKDYFYYYAELAEKMENTKIISDIDKPDMEVIEVSEPIGVIACIIPWNSQMFLTATKVAPALAAGCLLYTSPSPRDGLLSRMPSSA